VAPISARSGEAIGLINIAQGPTAARNGGHSTGGKHERLGFAGQICRNYGRRARSLSDLGVRRLRLKSPTTRAKIARAGRLWPPVSKTGVAFDEWIPASYNASLSGHQAG